jgi:hypothetical protein
MRKNSFVYMILKEIKQKMIQMKRLWLLVLTLAVPTEVNLNPFEELESPNLILRLNRCSKRYIFHILGFRRKIPLTILY